MEYVEVTDDDVVFRRIHPSQVNPATNRPSSAAFSGADSFDLSVDLARLTTAEAVMGFAKTIGRDCIGVVAFTVAQARQLGFEVRHDPLPDTDPDGPNPAHTLVVGEKDKPKQKPARALSRLCRWVWPPEMQQFNEPDVIE